MLCSLSGYLFTYRQKDVGEFMTAIAILGTLGHYDYLHHIRFYDLLQLLLSFSRPTVYSPHSQYNGENYMNGALKIIDDTFYSTEFSFRIGSPQVSLFPTCV